MEHFETASIPLFTSFTSAGRCWGCLGVIWVLQHFSIYKILLMLLQKRRYSEELGWEQLVTHREFNWLLLLSLATLSCTKVCIISTQSIPALQPLLKDSSCLTRLKDLWQYDIQVLFVSKYLKQGQCNISVTYSEAGKETLHDRGLQTAISVSSSWTQESLR